MAEVKRVEPGWLARSFADAQAAYEANRDWYDRLRANWLSPEPPPQLQHVKPGWLQRSLEATRAAV